MSKTGILRCTSGSSAAEFAMVLPLLLIFLLGTVDAGRFLWDVNQAQKATQAGARLAAVTNMIPSGLASYSFATQGALTPGTPVPASAFDAISCTSAGCQNGDPSDDCQSSATGTFTESPGFDSDAFDRVVARMSAIDRQIGEGNVRVTYCNVGLGYAGNPYGSDASPQVIVSVQDMSFEPIPSLLFGSVDLPSSSSSMPMEDGVGAISN